MQTDLLGEVYEVTIASSKTEHFHPQQFDMCTLHYHDAVHCGECDCVMEFDARGRFRCRYSLTTNTLCIDEDCDIIYAKGGPKRRIASWKECIYCTDILQSQLEVKDKDKDALAKAKERFAPKTFRGLAQELDKINASPAQTLAVDPVKLVIPVRNLLRQLPERILGKATEGFEPAKHVATTIDNDVSEHDEASSIASSGSTEVGEGAQDAADPTHATVD